MKCYMGLTCRVGSYTRVMQELVGLNVSPDDLKELLFGPIDILIQFTALESLDKFVETWFNPIRMVGAEEALITQTLTFIVIVEGPAYTEDPFAFLFINTPPRHLDTVREALLSIPGVLSADTVFGPYDVICPVEALDRADFDRLIAHILRNIPEIERSLTAIVAQPRR